MKTEKKPATATTSSGSPSSCLQRGVSCHLSVAPFLHKLLRNFISAGKMHEKLVNTCRISSSTSAASHKEKSVCSCWDEAQGVAGVMVLSSDRRIAGGIFYV